MREFIARELRFLMWAVCSGAIFGVTYWIIGVFRKIVPHHKFFVGVEDMLFWFAAAFFMFAVILVANDGAVRWFALGGMVFGMFIISMVLKYMEKCITIICYKIGKARERTYEGRKRKAG